MLTRKIIEKFFVFFVYGFPLRVAVAEASFQEKETSLLVVPPLETFVNVPVGAVKSISK